MGLLYLILIAIGIYVLIKAAVFIVTVFAFLLDLLVEGTAGCLGCLGTIIIAILGLYFCGIFIFALI